MNPTGAPGFFANGAPAPVDLPKHLNTTAIRILIAVQCGATTYTEILAHYPMSRSSVHHHLHQLRKLGLVTFSDEKKRGTIRPVATIVAATPERSTK